MISSKYIEQKTCPILISSTCKSGVGSFSQLLRNKIQMTLLSIHIYTSYIYINDGSDGVNNLSPNLWIGIMLELG